MRRIISPLLLLALLAACSSDSKKSDTTDAAGGSEVTLGDGGQTTAGTVDPAVTPGCSILTQEQMASIFGDAEGQWNANSANADELAECQWYSADGRSIAFQIFMLDLPDGNLPTTDERVEVGVEAYYHETAGIPFLDANIRGWLVGVTGVQGTVTRDQVLALARLLDSVLIERSQSAVAAGGSSDGGSTDGSDVVTLTDMSVTIDQPASIAGTMTLADLNSTSSLAICGGPWTLDSLGKMFTVVYEFGVMTDGATSPAPVVGFSLTAQGEYTGPGMYPADVRVATSSADVYGTGSMTVNEDQLTGTFTYSDASGTITGSWMCAGS